MKQSKLLHKITAWVGVVFVSGIIIGMVLDRNASASIRTLESQNAELRQEIREQNPETLKILGRERTLREIAFRIESRGIDG